MTDLTEMSPQRLAERIEALEAVHAKDQARIERLERVVLDLSMHALRESTRVRPDLMSALDAIAKDLAELDRSREEGGSGG